MKAAILTEYRKFEVKELSLPEIKSNEVLIRIEYASICGSDMHVFKGDFAGRTPVPFIPGHEMAGIVEMTGSDVKNYKTGDRAAIDPLIWCGKCPACLKKHYPACTALKLTGIDLDGGFTQYMAIPEWMLYKVASSIPAKHAALVEIYSIGFHANNRAGVKAGDVLAIWGAGRVGQVVLQAARTKTKEKIFIVDILDSRLEIAAGSNENVITINALRENPVEVIKNHTNGNGVDIAFEAIGDWHHIEGVVNPVRGCIQSIRGGGIVCALGLTDEPSPIVFKELIWKEGKIITSRVSHGEFAESLAHLAKGDLKPDALITEIMPLEKIQEAFEMVENDPSRYLKILIDMGQY
jgi:threonine dehydrogenase-like Zn-dependent dehydrogenase